LQILICRLRGTERWDSKLTSTACHSERYNYCSKQQKQENRDSKAD